MCVCRTRQIYKSTIMDYKEKVIALLNSKELSQEQKEKLESIFPELAESEDERIRKALINGFNKLDKSAVWYNGITNGQILAWLEKQSKDSPVLSNSSNTGKFSWSEEDEQTFIKSVEALEDFGKFELADWLKEHKNQCLTPQSQWKPSEEQIKALLKLEEMHVLEHEKNQENAHLYMVVKSIREQLLKLREEQ